jgi:hypothetical protein
MAIVSPARQVTALIQGMMGGRQAGMTWVAPTACPAPRGKAAPVRCGPTTWVSRRWPGLSDGLRVVRQLTGHVPGCLVIPISEAGHSACVRALGLT